ncbi:MAG: hypothetical protein EZS28_046045, partial [Streblomastix strix]
MRYPTLADLYVAISDFIENKEKGISNKDVKKNIKNNEAEIVYESGRYTIVVPKTREASILYGTGTKWCVSAKVSENYFEHYSSSGPLYMIFDKANNVKYCFQFPSNEFRYENDVAIRKPIKETLGFADDIMAFLKKAAGRDEYELYADGVHGYAENREIIILYLEKIKYRSENDDEIDGGDIEIDADDIDYEDDLEYYDQSYEK